MMLKNGLPFLSFFNVPQILIIKVLIFFGFMIYNHHYSTNGLVYCWTEIGRAIFNIHVIVPASDHESLN